MTRQDTAHAPALLPRCWQSVWRLIPDSCERSAWTRRQNPTALNYSDFQIHSGHRLIKSGHHLKVEVGPCSTSEVLVPGVSLCTPPWVLPCLSILPGRTQRSFLLPANAKPVSTKCSLCLHSFSSTWMLKSSPLEEQDFSMRGTFETEASFVKCS